MRTVMEQMPARQMPVNGVNLAYAEDGLGESVVFVHGAGGDWRTWDPLRPFMAATYRYVAYSRRYHWPNPWPGDGTDYSEALHVSDLAAFIRALDVGRVHVVGSSYGGRIVAYCAYEHPELLRSVVIGEPSLAAATAGDAAVSLAAQNEGMAAARRAAQAGDGRQSATILLDTVLGEPGASATLDPRRLSRWLDNAETMGPMFASRRPATMTCTQWNELEVPALLVQGEKTRRDYAAATDAFLSCLPEGTEHARIPDAGHLWAPDNPEASAAAILAFVAKH